MSSYDEFDCYRGSCDYNGDNFIPDRSGHVSDNEDIGEDDNSIDKGNCSTDEGDREIDRDDHRVNKGSTDEGDCTNDEYDCGNDEGADCNNDESDCNNSESDCSNDESDGSINEGNSDEEFSGISSNEEDNLQFDPMMFEPIYENAPILLCGAFCAIMEFKRSCNLSFSCIDRLLQLLQLFCPPSNSLPHSVYAIREFFRKYSTTNAKRRFCSNCEQEFSDVQQKCDKVACKNFEPNTFISFNVFNAIKRIMKSKFRCFMVCLIWSS